jgi:hypothetical protein
VDFKAEMKAEQELIQKAGANVVNVNEANSDAEIETIPLQDRQLEDAGADAVNVTAKNSIPVSVTLPLQDCQRNEAGTDAVNAIKVNENADTVTIPMQDLQPEEAGANAVNVIAENSDAVSVTTENSVKASTTKKEMTILAYLVFNRSKSLPDILDHPVAQTFLDLKWARMKKVILINIIVRIAAYALYICLAMLIYFYDCPHNNPVGNYNTSLQQGPKAVNGSQLEQDVLEVKCKWSLLTLIALPIVFLFIFLFFAYEVVNGFQVGKFENKFLRKKITLFRIFRMICFLLAIGTMIPPWCQRSLWEFQYPIAAVRVWV